MNRTMGVWILGISFLLLIGWTGSAVADYSSGYALYKDGKFVEALDELAKVAPDQSEYLTARYLKGLCYMKLDKNLEAKAELEGAVEAKPDYGKACTNLARVLLKLDENEKAKEMAQKGVEFEADSGAYNVLGLVYMRLENYEQANAAFTKSSELDAKNAWAFNNRGISLIRQHKDNPKEVAEEALKLFNQAVSIQPENTLFVQNQEFAKRLMSK